MSEALRKRLPLSHLPLHDKIFFLTFSAPVIIVSSVLFLLFMVLLLESIPVLRIQGISTYISTTWRPSIEPPPSVGFFEIYFTAPPGASAWYGLLPAIAGTFITSLVAIMVSLPLSISLVVFMEEILPKGLKEPVALVVDLMAGMPTILFGVWGLSVLGPFLARHVAPLLHDYLGFLPLFSCAPLTGYNALTAGILLGIMILPFMTAIIQESYRSIPYTYREAAWSIGLTRFEYVSLNMSMISPAIVSAVLLGLGRAMSETAAVALVVGNVHNLTTCVLSPMFTVTSLIANKFAEAALYPYLSNALFAGGFLLLAFGLVINTAGLLYMRKVRF
ncbi:MAG: phosphate ABC transporter permease subunit PstC [Acidilobaceae archaeon]